MGVDDGVSSFLPDSSLQGAAPLTHAEIVVITAIAVIGAWTINMFALISWLDVPELAVTVECSCVVSPPFRVNLDGHGEGGDQGDDGDFGDHFVWRIVCVFFNYKSWAGRAPFKWLGGSKQAIFHFNLFKNVG